MPYGNQDWAVVLPQNNNSVNQYELYRDNLAREDRLSREREASQARQTNTVMDAFKDQDYLSGSPLDPVFRKQLADVRQKYASIIKEGKMSDADVMFMIQKDMGKIGSQSIMAKNLRAQIKDAVKDYTKDKGINGQAIEALALQKIFFDGDKLRGPNDIQQSDPLKTINDVMENNPEQIVDQNVVWSNYLKGLGRQKKNWEPTYDSMGKKTKLGYKAELYPFQRPVQDKDGNLIYDKQGRASAETAYDLAETTKIQSLLGTQNITERDRKLAPEDQYLRAMSDYGTRAVLNTELKKYNVDPNSKDADILRRKILYDKFDSEGKEFSPTNEMDVEAWRGKLDAQGSGINVNITAPKQDKGDTKYENSPAGRFQSLELKPATAGPTPDFSLRGSKKQDLMGQVGGLLDKYGKRYESIDYDPSTNKIRLVDSMGESVEVDADKRDEFLKSISGANKVPVDKLKKQEDKPKKESSFQKAISPLKKESARDRALRLLKEKGV